MSDVQQQLQTRRAAHLSSDEERMVAYIAWRAKAESSVDAQIALDTLVEHLLEGRHQSWG